MEIYSNGSTIAPLYRCLQSDIEIEIIKAYCVLIIILIQKLDTFIKKKYNI